MEPLMNKHPQTEFEKLVWERHMNKLLTKELEDLRKKNEDLEIAGKEQQEAHNREMKELLERMKKDQVGVLVVKNRKLNTENIAKSIKLKNLKRDNDELMAIIIEKNKVLKKEKPLLQDNIDERAG